MHISSNVTLVQGGESSSLSATLYTGGMEIDLLRVSCPVICHIVSSDGLRCVEWLAVGYNIETCAREF